jgi:hypothetical protein
MKVATATSAATISIAPSIAPTAGRTVILTVTPSNGGVLTKVVGEQDASPLVILTYTATDFAPQFVILTAPVDATTIAYTFTVTGTDSALYSTPSSHNTAVDALDLSGWTITGVPVSLYTGESTATNALSFAPVDAPTTSKSVTITVTPSSGTVTPNSFTYTTDNAAAQLATLTAGGLSTVGTQISFTFAVSGTDGK